MISITITFCGHRTIDDSDTVYNHLIKTLENFFKDAFTLNRELTFFCGGYGEFDLLSSKAIDKLREIYTLVKIKKIFVTPYITGNAETRNQYMKKFYDEILYPPLENVPKRFCIIKRNEWMVEHSDFVISYLKYDWGGAKHTFDYAIKKKKHIIPLSI